MDVKDESKNARTNPPRQPAGRRNPAPPVAKSAPGPGRAAQNLLSPESVGRDRGDKFYEYAQGGVPEYWLLDPQMEWAEFYRLENARYRPLFTGQKGKYQSPTLAGFWLQVEWLWQRPLPRVLAVIRELRLI